MSARDSGYGYDHGPDMIAAAVLIFIFTAGLVALRFYTRVRIARVLGAEDWTILVALVLSLGVSIATVTEHAFRLRTALRDGFRCESDPHWKVSLAFTKVSILILYLRLLTYHYARWGVYFMLAVVGIYNIWGFANELTVCTPLSKLWDDKGYGSCHPITYTWAVIGLHIVTDFLIFFLPIPVFVTVKMSSAKKMAVLAAFTVGFIACIISIVRAVRIWQISCSTGNTFDNVEVTYWNLAEINTSIICACLMTFKPLISHFWPRWLTASDANCSAEGSDGRPKTVTRIPTRPRTISTEEIAMVDFSAQASQLSRVYASPKRHRSLSTGDMAMWGGARVT